MSTPGRRDAVPTTSDDAAEWSWRAYRAGFLDGLSNPGPRYEDLGYERAVALAEAGATAYVAMIRFAADAAALRAPDTP